MPVERKHIMVLALARAQDQGLSPIQLQKSLFLVARSGLDGIPDPFYSFQPYNYGPFDSAVYRDVSQLIEEGLVHDTRPPGQGWPQFTITSRGSSYVDEVKSQVSQSLSSHIEAVVDWVEPLSFTALLRAIYAAFPEYRENSVFQDC